MISDDTELAELGYQSTWSTNYTLKMIDYSFKHMIDGSSPQAPQPPRIQMPLRPHQRSLLHAMMEREIQCTNGIQFKNTTTYSNYGILGGEVGTGKSLTVLSYIAALKQLPEQVQVQNMLYSNSKRHFFTIYKKEYSTKLGTNVIVIPHTIYRQWQEYCKKQTTLNIFFAKSQKDLQPALVNIEFIDTNEKREEAVKKRDTWLKELAEYDAILISNTLYSELQRVAELYSITWKRMFIDEIDSIYISGTNEAPNAAFTWFITATWPNFVLFNRVIRPEMLIYYSEHRANFSSNLGIWLEEELGQSIESAVQGIRSGRSTRFTVRSSRWIQSFLSDHILGGMVVLHCTKDFLKESQQMPPILDTILLCQQSATHRALGAIVSPQIQNMLHAGNIEGALEQLGVSANTSMNLVEAATKEREKELDRLRKTLVFKESIDYATPQTKEAALAFLRGKINSVEEQLNTFRSRLLNITLEECPICYEDPRTQSGTLTPCCHRIFCGGCILNSLSRNMSCPMCRTIIKPSQLVHLVEESLLSKKQGLETELLSKQKQLLKFLKEHSDARVLVFSRYENPFLQLETSCENEGITHHVLRGNKDAIASTIKSFEKGEKRVLFLPIESGGAGLNLVSATHVILLHAMTPEEEKQAIGRAYRLGRNDSLQVIRLLHQGETIAAASR
jgi:SNF2 family DNA or RNA helicase